MPTRRELPIVRPYTRPRNGRVGDGQILENCIEKNFHVSAMTHKSGHSIVAPTLRLTLRAKGVVGVVQFCVS
jgi:hypothetical protein